VTQPRRYRRTLASVTHMRQGAADIHSVPAPHAGETFGR